MDNASQDYQVFLSRKVLIPTVLCLLVLLGGGMFRGCFVTFVDNYETGYTYNRMTGRIQRLHRNGYILANWFTVDVHTVDVRPMQVCINANNRVLNCKLVQFNSAGLEIFLEWHGRDNYDANALNPILMSYAYDGSGRTYPFLTVLRELRSNEDEQGRPTPSTNVPSSNQ